MKKTFAFLSVIVLVYGCKDDAGAPGETPSDETVASPAVIQFSVVNEFPHDTGSYTEGLAFYNGVLFEGTGASPTVSNNGTWIGPIDLKTGKVQKKVDLGNQFFGEGITFFNDKVYQLTYQTKKGFVYDARTFKKLKEFTYNSDYNNIVEKIISEH